MAYENGYDWAQEAHESLQKFCEEFNLSYRGSNFSTNSDATVRMSNIDDTILELSGIRLMKYIINNHYDVLYTAKTYGKYEKRENGNYRYSRYSRIQKKETSCPFTGYCMDDDLLYPIREFLKNPLSSVTFKDLMKNCINAWVKSANDDCNGQESDEYIIENIRLNEYEFHVNGDRY